MALTSTHIRQFQKSPKPLINLRKKALSLDSWAKFYPKLIEAVARSHELQDDPTVTKLVGALRGKHYGLAVEQAEALLQAEHGGNARMFFARQQLANLVRKVPFEDPALDPRGKAERKFSEAEKACAETNDLLRNFAGGGVLPARRDLYLSLGRAREWIRDVIGETPNLDSIYRGCDFGPGASVGVSGLETHTAVKLESPWTCTPRARFYALHALGQNAQVWEYLLSRGDSEIFCRDPEKFREAFNQKLKPVDYNKIAFVPKTATTDRSIAVEPSLNTFLQSGVDKFLKTRLRRYGVDLERQDLNQVWAREGSLGGLDPYVTIDLAAASDSLSTELVRELLPVDWFEFLNDLRCHYWRDPNGDLHYYEKFCSMGNGFCFPLESLIFAALCVTANDATGNSEFRVYGDDIIVRQSAAPFLIDLLNLVGFGVNKEKTFLEGPFRESCGADYFEGINVRPYVLDEIPDNIPALIKLANGLASNLFHVPLEAFWYVVEAIPVSHRYVRPYSGNPDSAITVPMDYFMSSKFARWDYGIQNWSWVELRTRPRYSKGSYSTGVLMYGLLRGTQSGDEDDKTLSSSLGPISDDNREVISRRGIPKFALRRATRTSKCRTSHSLIAPV